MTFTPANVEIASAGEPPNPILDLLYLCFASMEGRINPPSSLHRMTPADISQHLETQTVFLIKKPAPIACLFATTQADHLYLGKIATHPDYRGKGALNALLSCVTEHARAQNLPKLRLQTRIELSENHTIFAHYGFVKTAEGTHPGFTHPTEITMEKSL